MELTDKQILEIAENLIIGMRCFYNLKTGEIEEVPNLEDIELLDQDNNPWQETLDKLDENCGDYFEFENMTPHESFEIMADFAETVDNANLQDKLINALNKPKPFRNFKWEIDNSDSYRQKWFDFKDQRMIDFVKTQIVLHNRKTADDC